MTYTFWEKLGAKLIKQNRNMKEEYEKALRILGTIKAFAPEDLIAVLRNKQMPIEIRGSVSWIIGQMKYKRAVGVLLETIREKNKLLIWESAKALGALKSKKSTSPLISLLLNGNFEEHRVAAAYTLGQIKDSAAVEALIAILRSEDEPPRLRGQAAESLAYLSDERSFDVLLASLKDPAVEVRFWSVFALGELRDERAVKELMQIIDCDSGILSTGESIREEAKVAYEKTHP